MGCGLVQNRSFALCSCGVVGVNGCLCVGVVLAGVLRNVICPDTSRGGAYRSDPSGLGGLVF